MEGWGLFLDRVQGRFDDIGVPGTAGINDHSINAYLSLAGATPGGYYV